MELYPYQQFDLLWLEKMYTAKDKFTDTEFACGYILDEGKLYIPKGTPVSKLKDTIPELVIDEKEDSDPIEYMSRKHYSNYDLRDKVQHDSVRFLKGEGHQLGLNLMTGVGKSNPLSTPIKTPDGWTTMGDLKVGDTVLGGNFKPCEVMAIYPQGAIPVYTMTLENGSKARCSYQHLWFVKMEKGKKVEYFVCQLSRMLRHDGAIFYVPQGEPYKWVRVVDIEASGKEECQCITVDDPNALYVINDDIITHNTFCVAYASTELGEKTIVITPNSSIKSQWIKTYSTMFDYKSSELCNIAGSNIMEGLEEKYINPADVYFVNHQTLRSYIANHGAYRLRQWFSKLGCGIKVYDESHMEFANILLMDFLSNVNRTWYLTATFDRSDKSESICFKQAFSSVDTYGKAESQEVRRKHVIYHIVKFNSRISYQNRAKLMGWPGFSANKYGHYSIFEDPNDTLYKAILEILNKTTEMEGKTLIFVPLIECVDEVVKRLKKDYSIKSVAAYHSKIDKEEKESAEKKDIIVSTIKSCGTGKDIKGLRSVICAEPMASKVIAEQTIGRLRPYSDDKDTYFWDLIDVSIQNLIWFHRSRFKAIEPLVKEIVEINDIFA